MVTRQSSEIMAISPSAHAPLSKYDRLIARAKEVPPASTIIVHPCDETSLRGAIEAAEAGIIIPREEWGPRRRSPAAQDAAIRKISSILWRLVCCFARIRWPRGDVLFDFLP